MSQNIGQEGQSFLGYVGLAEESEFAGDGEPSVFNDAMSASFEVDNAVQYLNTIRSRGRPEGTAGALEDSGEIELAAAPENGFGLLLKAALGEASVTTSDPDGDSTTEVGTHVFDTAARLPSLAVEVGEGDIQAVRHVGCGVSSLELEHSSEEYLTASFELPATEPQPQSSQASPTYSNLRPFVYHDGALTIDGTDRSIDLDELTISIENNVEHQFRAAARTASKATVGTREITAEGTLDFSSPALFEKTLGTQGATRPERTLYEGSLEATWTSPETIDDTATNYSLRVTMPRVVIETREAELSEDELIAESVTFGALEDVDGTGNDMQVELVNGKTSAY